MKIAVVGSINMDQTVIAERIPLKGETLRGTDLQYIPGGKGANQAVAMARLGAEVAMFGCVGNDDNGKKLTAKLKAEGINVDNIKVVDDSPTGLAIITVGENDNTIVVVSGANGDVNKEYVDAIKEKLFQYDMVVLQHEIPIETVHYVINLCYEKGISTVLNPAPAACVPKDIIDKVTYITPNEHEASLIFGSDKATEEMLKMYPEKLLITQGSKGVSTCLKSGEIFSVPCRKSKVVDTTGAGDTLNGAFAVRVSEKSSIKEALEFANIAAGISTEKMGAQGGMPTLWKVEAELEGYSR